jgi:hypothetical protein
MSAIGYLGLVAGPALVGAISSGLGLRAGLGFLAIAGTLVAVTPVAASR